MAWSIKHARLIVQGKHGNIDQDHLTKPLSLLPSISSQYYIIDGWPELLLGVCEHHTCPETHVCEFRYIDLYPTYTCVLYDLTTVPSATPLSPTNGCTNVLPAVSEVIFNSTTVRFSPVACVHSPGTTMGTLLHNYRDEQIDWFNMQPIIEGCAGLAYTNSYRYFGIEFYGECWADGVFVEASHSKIPANQCDSETYLAVGVENVICVYEVL
ncbi:uncharacterized protein LOC110458879 [Mizuhopecten yessoensis]|uniref:uncharacterized protein LOC110458879 n=1 Tax=Mizuhopecten yessoensis TaxID=6573 RepID=UPI000B45E71A|nr:uncharacterized protein LOC110458879 [Mizuhopecten yessoensis]